MDRGGQDEVQEEDEQVDRSKAKGLQFKCDTCDKAYKTENGLKLHQGRKTNILCHRMANKIPPKESKKSGSYDIAQGMSSIKMRKQAYSKHEKQNAINTFEKYLGQRESTHTAFQRASRDLNIPVRKIQEFTTEKATTGELKDNHRKRKSRRNFFERLDDFQKNGIRKAVHKLIRDVREAANPNRDTFDTIKYPTLALIHKEIEKDESIPKMSPATLRTVLSCLKFKYVDKGLVRKNHLLLEKNGIREWRRRYLRKIKRFRREGRPIFYTDETYVNENHTRKSIWVDTSVKSARQAFQEGVTTGIQVPSGKGRRLIIIDIGNEEGALPGAREVWICGKKNQESDYHSEVDSTIFQDWMLKTAELLPAGAVIVLDNASYHNTQTGVPKSGSKKAEMVAYLEQRGVKVKRTGKDKDTVKTLWQKVKQIKINEPMYDIDQALKEKGIEVLRLPPYHPELNAIELVWADIKGQVASRNAVCKINTLKDITHDVMDGMTAEKWAKCIRHTVDVEEKYYQMEGLYNLPDDADDELIIRIDSDDSDSDFEEPGVPTIGSNQARTEPIQDLDHGATTSVSSHETNCPSNVSPPSGSNPNSNSNSNSNCKIFHCIHCRREFQNRKGLSVHEATHVSCASCGKEFFGKYSAKNLMRHFVNCGKDRPQIQTKKMCDICGKVLSRARDLVRHVKTHTKPKVPCPTCDATFPTRNGLNGHKCPNDIKIYQSNIVMEDSVNGEVVGQVARIPLARPESKQNK